MTAGLHLQDSPNTEAAVSHCCSSLLILVNGAEHLASLSCSAHTELLGGATLLSEWARASNERANYKHQAGGLDLSQELPDYFR